MENVASAREQRGLGQVLVEKGLISRRDLARALEVQLRTPDRLGRILMSLDIIRRRQLYPVLAEMWGLPFVDLVAIRPTSYWEKTDHGLVDEPVVVPEFDEV